MLLLVIKCFLEIGAQNKRRVLKLHCHKAALGGQQSPEQLGSSAGSTARYIFLTQHVTPVLTQNQIHGNQLRRAEQEGRCHKERVQTLTAQNKDLHMQLQEIKRRQAEIECKVQ